MQNRTILAVLALGAAGSAPLPAVAQFRAPPPLPSTEAAPDPAATDRARAQGQVGPLVYSATVGASVILGHVVRTECYLNEEDWDHDGTDLDCTSHNERTGSTATADFRGGLGFVVSRSPVTQSLGYQLHLGIADGGIIHRHELAWRFTAPRVFSAATFVGASLSSPWEGGGSTGFNFGVDAQAWVSGPFVVGAHFTMDGFEEQHAILLGFGAFVGIAG